MKNVLVTGATGFVGGRLAWQLLDEGYDVRVLARTPEKARWLEEQGADVVRGDILDRDSLDRAMEDRDGVFHLAAAYRLGGDPEFMYRVNVEGTQNVLDAAAEAGIERIVYCGSDTSLGDTKGKLGDESHEHDGDFRSTYAMTKHDAHTLVSARMEAGEPIVNAIVSTVYGPGDTSPIAELIEAHLAGVAVAYLDPAAGYTFAHVDDVATALRLAYEQGEPGESYLISGTPATFEDFFRTLSRQTGISTPRFELPDGLVERALPLIGRLAPMFGKSSAELREMVAMGRDVTRFFSGAKARRELGWEPRSLREGLADTLPWFQRKEAESAREFLAKTRVPLAGLSAFDVGLGGVATLLPKTYRKLIHRRAEDGAPTHLVTRTGILWLVFALVQGMAAADPVERPGWVMTAGALRLMDVPADLAYLLESDDLGWLGKLGLLSSPIFNFASGAFFLYAGYRGLRARKWEP